MRSVLVLDDDVHIAELMRVVLEDAGYSVHVSTAESEIPDERFACIVSDLMSVSAYSIEEARAWTSRVADRFPDVPLIVVTAHPEAAQDAASLCARAVIMKPFDVETLLTAVREVAAS